MSRSPPRTLHRPRAKRPRRDQSIIVDPRDLGLDPRTYEPLASAIARGSATGQPPSDRPLADQQQQDQPSFGAVRAGIRATTNPIDPRSVGLDPRTYEPLASALARRSAAGQLCSNRPAVNLQQQQQQQRQRPVFDSDRARMRATTNPIDRRSVGLDPRTYEHLPSALARQSARSPASASASASALVQPGTSILPANHVRPIRSHVAYRPNDRESVSGETTVTDSTITDSTITDSDDGGLDNQNSDNAEYSSRDPRRRATGAGPRATQGRPAASRGVSATSLITELIVCEEMLADKKAELTAFEQGRFQYKLRYPGKSVNEIRSYIVESISDRAKCVEELKKKVQELQGSQSRPAGPDWSHQGRHGPASGTAGPSGSSARGFGSYAFGGRSNP